MTGQSLTDDPTLGVDPMEEQLLQGITIGTCGGDITPNNLLHWLAVASILAERLSFDLKIAKSYYKTPAWWQADAHRC